MIAATGDWTKMMLTVEGPAVAGIYKLFNKEDHLRYVRFDFNHNYNQTSREAVYGWFDRWLLGQPDSPSAKETPYMKEPDAELRVFPDDKLPGNALTERAFVQSLVKMCEARLEGLRPHDRVSLERFRREMIPAWKHTLEIGSPDSDVLVEAGEVRKSGDYTVSTLAIGHAGKGDRLPVVMISPKRDVLRNLVVLAHPDGKSAWLDNGGAPVGLARKILDRGDSVILFDAFLTGEPANAGAPARKHQDLFFTTYNRTDLQERVRDCATVCAFAQAHTKGRRVILFGTKRAGLWALLAAPIATAVAADCDSLDSGDDSVLMEPDLFVPGIRRIGGFAGVAALAAPHPLLLFNTGKSFSKTLLQSAYAAAGAPGMFRAEQQRPTDDALADWLDK
jgi:hypothetical protein